MTPPFDRAAPAPEPCPFPGTSPSVIEAATARASALGIEGEIVLVTRDPKEMKAFLGVEEDACASSS